MAKLYLETTIISSAVTNRKTLRSLDEHAITLDLLENHSKSHELFVSDSVVLELSAPTYPRRNEALALASTYGRLSSTPAANALAKVFVDHLVMPRNLAGDALHVAIATLAQMDVLLTWNVAHLANENKQRHLLGCVLTIWVPTAAPS